MIGPHEGKELELMLSGKKRLAVFSEAMVPDQEISEDIIPELSFQPHTCAGRISREAFTLTSPIMPFPALYVCFTPLGQEWRAETFKWLQTETFARRFPCDDAYEYFVGRLLDYDEADIDYFIKHKKAMLLKRAPLA